MSAQRVTPVLASGPLAHSAQFYRDVLDLEPVMDLGWVMTLAAPGRPSSVVHPLTDEPWGVRRFFVMNPAGHVVNVLAHR